MPQDAFTLRLNAIELDAALTGGRINRISQPGREEVSMVIYTGKRTVKLILNANASDCGIYFSEDERENPLIAPNFCMLLRKHLQSAEITSIEQVGFERILALHFKCVSDFSSCERILYAEIMGKYSNLLLTENGVILGALKTNTPDEGCRRLILPGAKYVLPAPQDKIDPRDKFALTAICAHAEGDLAHFLFTRVSGLAPCTAELIAKSFSGGDLAAHVYDFIFSDEVQPCVVERGGTVVDFHARMAENATKFATLSEAQCYFYAKKRSKNLLEGARRRLTSAVSQAIKKQEKRLAQILEKQRTAADAESIRQKGELITANLWALTRGMKSCELVNYYDEKGGTVRIALDERLTPSQNAQAYFKRYQKQKRTLEALAPQEADVRRELAYLESLPPLLASADSTDDLKALEEELVAAGLVKLPQQPQARGAKKKPEIPFRVYEAGGFAVYAGRSNLQNDRLVRSSAPDDIWLHARQLHSAHVVIRTNGRKVPERVLAYAAAICAKYSAGKGDKIPVDWCRIKYVRKPKGAKAGFVTYTDFETVLGDPARADAPFDAEQ